MSKTSSLQSILHARKSAELLSINWTWFSNCEAPLNRLAQELLELLSDIANSGEVTEFNP